MIHRKDVLCVSHLFCFLFAIMHKKHKKSPWITKGIIKSLTCRDKLYRSFKQCRVGSEVYNILKTNLHTFNRILKWSISSAKKVYYNNVFNQYKFNIKKTWGTIKDILNKKNNTSASPDSLNINADIIKDKKKLADHFNNYFANIGHILSQQITANYNSNVSYSDFLDNSTNSRFKFSLVSESVIDKIINDILAKNSSGPAGISTKLLKLVKHDLISPLTNIVNQTLSTGIFPDKLKIAKVIPIYKKGDSLLAENYRPIFLLSSLSEIFKKVMLIQIKQYLEEHNSLYKSQYGFRENHSTEYAALELIDHIFNNLDNGKVPFSIFLDLSKAFDTLDHTILTQKLKHHGIKDCALKLLKNYLSNRKQYVELNNIKSEMSEIKTGVPQGSILGPLLFVIYVNDIYKASSILHAIIYADDTTLTANLKDFSAKTKKDLENKINSEINKINIWLKANRLSLNTLKSKFMLYYKPPKRVPIPVLKVNNTEITSVDTFNFLGLSINKNLNWKPHVEKTAGKISKVIGVINRLKFVVPQIY